MIEHHAIKWLTQIHAIDGIVEIRIQITKTLSKDHFTTVASLFSMPHHYLMTCNHIFS